MSLFKRMLAPDPTSLTKEPIIPDTSPRIEALKTAVAANDSGSNVIPMMANVSGVAPVRRTDPNIVNNVVLPGAANENDAPAAENLVQEPIEIPKEPEVVIEIASDHLLGAPTEPIQGAELPTNLRITGENVSVQNFLPEIYQLLKLGKELDLIMQQRGEMSVANHKVTDQIRESLVQAKSIQEIMAEFLATANIEVSREQLVSALSGYETFLESFQAETSNQESVLRTEDNKLIATINGLKTKISGLIKIVGGIQNFEQIKLVFKTFNEMRRKGIDTSLSITAEEINAILERQNNPDNAINLRQLAGSGDILGVLVRMYSDPSTNSN